jgi:hypothetical protein
VAALNDEPPEPLLSELLDEQPDATLARIIDATASNAPLRALNINVPPTRPPNTPGSGP